MNSEYPRDFDWTEHKESVVFPTVCAVAVYVNPDDMVVIRQESRIDVLPEAVVVVPADRIDDLIMALERARDEAGGQ